MSLPGGDKSTIESPLVYDRPLLVKYLPAPEKVLYLDPKKIIPGKCRPEPQKRLFDQELVYSWSQKSMASGLVNLRNTCFLASVVQCLQHIPALNKYLLVQHKIFCEDSDQRCIICMVMRLTEQCFSSIEPVEPKELAFSLQEIAPHLIRGRQEDAHEFLHSLLNRMQEDLTYNLSPKPDQYVEMTTPIGQIFGGFLRSQIVCLGCNRASNSYESLLSISLEIKSSGTLTQALDSFVSPEDMGGEGWYSCDACKVKQRAIKSYSIDTPPQTLIIHLKRYNQEDRFQSKLSHHVEFGERLDLKPYISPERACEVRSTYELCSVLVHLGNHVGAGHYYSYVADPSAFNQSLKKSWYIMNDDAVLSTSWDKVKDSEAYLLFYIRTDCKSKKSFEDCHKTVRSTKFWPRCTVRLKPLEDTAELRSISTVAGPDPPQNGTNLIVNVESSGAISLLVETSDKTVNEELGHSTRLGSEQTIKNSPVSDKMSSSNRKFDLFDNSKRQWVCKGSTPPIQKLSNGCGSNKKDNSISESSTMKNWSHDDHVQKQEISSKVPIRRFKSDVLHNRRSRSRSRQRSGAKGERSYSRGERCRSRSRCRRGRSRSRGPYKYGSKAGKSRSRSTHRSGRRDSEVFRRIRTHSRRRHRHSSSSSQESRRYRSREGKERRSSNRRRDRYSRSRSRSRS